MAAYYPVGNEWFIKEEDLDAAIDVLSIELELTKKANEGDSGHDDEPEA